MIEIYADGRLVCDSRIEGHDLLELKVTTGINVGGTANIKMPAGHPAYNDFMPYKTVVTIYRDGVLRFRGRPLYPVDGFLGDRTIVCEGDLCFLRDSINRPYKYEASPRSIFVTILNAHNAQVDAAKQFIVGSVTVVEDGDESADYVTLESDSAEPTLNTLNKLIERCGGRLSFNLDSQGRRIINWLAEEGPTNSQTIELGANLLTYSSTGANTKNLATGIIPYGARDDETKKRLTIAAVNNGDDYIIDEAAANSFGVIMTTKVWDDVTKASTLLKKARAFLAESKLFITSLTVTALDLSCFDKDISSFKAGDLVRVVSIPHGVDAYFQLTQLVEDMLDPAKSQITLGKDLQSLTGSVASGNFSTNNKLDAVEREATSTLDLSGYVTADQLTGYVTTDALTGYATTTQLAGYAPVSALANYALASALNTEVSARAGVINKVDGVVHISGGAPIKMLGGVVTIDGTEINILKEARFGNESGIRIANTDGNVYYQLRVGSDNNTYVGTDTNKLYLRGPTVYLKSSGATVSSDERNKHSIEELPQAYVDMLDRLTPVRFKYKDGTSDRFHVGFIAQDVERALTEAGLTAQDFGGFVDLDRDGKTLGLAYDEFIGLLFQKIRGLEKRLNELEGLTND